MKKLVWDSEFWNIDMYHIETADIRKKRKISKKKYLFQALVSIDDLNNIKKLEEEKFHFKESKITLFKNNFQKSTYPKDAFKNLSKETLFNNRKLIDDMFFKNTRFDIFSREKVNQFYFTWLLNSTTGDMDDSCIGYFINGELAGFVTYSANKENISIGLLGVLPTFQGKGIAQKLLNFIENTAIENSLTSITVATQGKNLLALNAYLKNGYRILTIEQWYYYQKGITL